MRRRLTSYADRPLRREPDVQFRTGEANFVERGDLFTMIKARLMYALLFAATSLESVHAQSLKYPPIEEYLMPQANEIALAKSAAPANISQRATIKVLT